MKTVCLFDSDAYIRSFSATVIGCEKRGDRYAVILDRTAFFPEGGGQPADGGTLNGVEVTNVRSEGEAVVHFCPTQIPVGTTVEGVLDWDKRFALMQQHSGEHIVSGIIHDRFGFDNIGFHMGDEVICVDFNGFIPADELRSVEQKANEVVWANTESEVFYPTPEELAGLEYRSKKEIDGRLRIVRFPGVDCCACCGTHVGRTGEIGFIKLLRCTKAHGGTRIEMVCGKQAVGYFDTVNGQNDGIARLLSVQPPETLAATQKLSEDKNRACAKIASMEKRLFETIAKPTAAKKNCLLFEDDLSSDGVRELAIVAMDYCKGICAVFSGDDVSGYKYAIGAQNADLQSFVREMNGALCGRGGGKQSFVQGSVKAKKSDVDAYFASKEIF